MEFNINKMETNIDLTALKHKLAALDGIMQAEFKSTYLYDTYYPNSERQKESQPFDIR